MCKTYSYIHKCETNYLRLKHHIVYMYVYISSMCISHAYTPYVYISCYPILNLTPTTTSRRPGAFASSTARTERSPHGFVTDRPVLGRLLVMIDILGKGMIWKWQSFSFSKRWTFVGVKIGEHPKYDPYTSVLFTQTSLCAIADRVRWSGKKNPWWTHSCYHAESARLKA